MPGVHAAIIDPHLADSLLDGRKRVESRFARQRRLPYGRVSTGDRIYFKVSGQGVIGHAHVLRVRQFDNLTPRTIDSLRRRYNHTIFAPHAYWHARRDCRFGVLIWLGPFIRRTTRRKIPRQYGAGWVLLSPPRSCGT